MKVSCILDKNVISGTVLLDSILPVYMILQHKISFNGIDKYIDLKDVSINPTNKFFDFMFINPHYYTSLFLDVNGTKYEVIEGIEDSTTKNPNDDSIYTEVNREIEIDDISVVNSEMFEPLQQTFFNHSTISNLSNLSNFKSTSHFLYDVKKGLRADITKNDLILTNRLNINNATEITISVNGDKPDIVKVYNVRTSGLTIINNQRYYEYDSKHCYTLNILNPTEDIEIHLVYNKNFEEFRSVYLKDFFVANIPQYVNKNSSERVYTEFEYYLPDPYLLVFDYEMIPNFGLRTLASIRNDNIKILIQSSNSKLLYTKLIDDIIYYSEVISNANISNKTNISVYQDDSTTKFYINSVLVKTVVDNLSIDGLVTIAIGSSDDNQYNDCNCEINFAVYNEDKNI